MKTIAIVPARSGSKGFPHKNVAQLGSKTLLELAVGVGMGCALIDDVYVSTDSTQYEQLALQAGAKSTGLRKERLSGDAVPTVEVVLDLLEQIAERYDLVILLQPTSPLRRPEDITVMIELLKRKNADAAVSLVRMVEPHPYKLKRITKNGLVKPFISNTSSEVPRQQLPVVYKLNGAIYVVKTKALIRDKTFFPPNAIGHVMESGINIDAEVDFILVKTLYEQGRIEIYGL